MHRIFVPLLLSCAILLVASRLAAATVVTMSWSPVGNPGNAADTLTGFGAVSYSYNIATYDVTNNQYVAFLNSNDPTGADPLALYNSNMSNATYGGIIFSSGSAAGNMYSAVSANGSNPVNFVTWYDAIRLANWMDNGQPVFATEPTATNNATENGSYTLAGYTPTPSNGNNITRNIGAVVFLPSENEWYKAAYYNPAASSYFEYPTSSNSTPNANGPTSTPNSANYADGYLTAVGAYSGTTSPYGAFDMGGDVFQWNEALFGGSFRGMRGGSFTLGLTDSLQSSAEDAEVPFVESSDIGFRLASLPVPEPSTAMLATLACGAALLCRKRLQAPVSVSR